MREQVYTGNHRCVFLLLKEMESSVIDQATSQVKRSIFY
jgi:hypothetical protein